jgi:hypothetical protein
MMTSCVVSELSCVDAQLGTVPPSAHAQTRRVCLHRDIWCLSRTRDRASGCRQAGFSRAVGESAASRRLATSAMSSSGNSTGDGGGGAVGGDLGTGYGLLVVSVIGFGSCFVPIKRVDCGDGTHASHSRSPSPIVATIVALCPRAHGSNVFMCMWVSVCARECHLSDSHTYSHTFSRTFITLTHLLSPTCTHPLAGSWSRPHMSRILCLSLSSSLFLSLRLVHLHVVQPTTRSRA